MKLKKHTPRRVVAIAKQGPGSSRLIMKVGLLRICMVLNRLQTVDILKLLKICMIRGKIRLHIKQVAATSLTTEILRNDASDFVC